MSLPTQDRELICAPEAFRIMRAVRFRMVRESSDKKLFWIDLLRQLVHLTRKDHLVPNYISAKEWESLYEMPPIRPV